MHQRGNWSGEIGDVTDCDTISLRRSRPLRIGEELREIRGVIVDAEVSKMNVAVDHRIELATDLCVCVCVR